MKKLVFILVVIFLLNGCTKYNTPEHDSLKLSDENITETIDHPAHMLSGEEITETIEQYPKTKTFAGGFYYSDDLDDDGIKEIYILPWGSGVPIIHALHYYNPATDTFAIFEDDGKAYWYFIYKDELFVGSPSDEYMMIYDNMESVYIPYLEDGELKLTRANKSLEKEILGNSKDFIPLFGLWDE